MSKLFQELQSLKWDKRLTDWYLAKGEVTAEEVSKHMTALPDLNEACERFSLEMTEDSDEEIDQG